MPTDPRATQPPRRQDEAVSAFLAQLDHPHLPEIMALREIILGADDRIGEAIKWNAPSFHTTEHFATFNLRARHGVQLVLHRGAKARPPSERLLPDAPAGLLEWRANDRALLALRSMADVEARRDAIAAVVRAWIAHV